jgi:hypothetical protein
MRQVRIISGMVLIIVIITISVLLNLNEIKSFSKSNFAGIVINKSNHDIIVSDSLNSVIIPSGKTSKDLNIHDVDFIVIDREMQYEGSKYKNGVIKICDYATISIESSNEISKIKPSGMTFVCKFINDIGWFESMDQFKTK